MSDDVANYARSVAVRRAEDVLAPHYPTCLGCGPDAPHGYHLQVRREGDEVLAEHVFAEWHTARTPDRLRRRGRHRRRRRARPPALRRARPGVTRRLEVDYLKPVLTGVPYVVRGRLERREGRRLWVSCTGTGFDGVVAFRATGLFLVVDVSHFAQATSGGGQSPVAPQRARREPARRLPA